jgi:hypothetical protein
MKNYHLILLVWLFSGFPVAVVGIGFAGGLHKVMWFPHFRDALSMILWLFGVSLIVVPPFAALVVWWFERQRRKQ